MQCRYVLATALAVHLCVSPTPSCDSQPCCTPLHALWIWLSLYKWLYLQIAKLLIIPFVCAVESVWLGKVFSRSVIGSIVTVVAGVAIV